MARDFDGTDDRLEIAAHASIDGWREVTYCCWVEFDTLATPNDFARMLDKGHHDISGTGGGNDFLCDFSGMKRAFLKARQWGTSMGEWAAGTTGLAAGTRYHLAVVYDGNSTANDPTFYHNGVADSCVEFTTPAGAWTDDAHPLLIGCAGDINGDFGPAGGRVGFLNGAISHVVAHNGLLTAADINRAKWWGRPRGGLSIYHPGVTTKLGNEGTATADAVESGSPAGRSFPVPAVRPGTAMMGMGVGW